MKTNILRLVCATALALAVVSESVGQEGNRDSRPVRIREIEGMGKKGLVNTPVYSSSVSGASRKLREWGQIRVEYQTSKDPRWEWINTLRFKYHVLLMKRTRDKKREFTMLRGDVTYVDVQGGEEHQSTMFIRPQTIERYGLPVAVHVQITPDDGDTTAADVSEKLSGGALPEQWWDNDRLDVKDGLLYSRARSPFALIDIDNYETIQQ
ncbi:MAG: hypothetical protein O2923_04360 [Verrucomicrobia bacterium]|nr:hypothetical protein [Verrucomicrobiota bacterium]MDA1086634.1 hypothetical protein [Verrucomicrobiota bacterium]